MGLRVGYKQSEVGVIPEDWHVQRLKQISPGQSVGLVINPSSYFDSTGAIPMLVGSNVSPNSIDWSRSDRITEESNINLPASRIYEGDLVVVRVGDPGVAAVVPRQLDGCNCASMMIVRKSDRFVSEWLCAMFNSAIGESRIEGVQYGTAQKQFNISDAVEFKFPVPPLPEQRAIAAALTDVDMALAGILRLIAKKRDLKQAAMQNLLTRQTRLPGFSGQWQVKRLADLLQYEQPTKYLVSDSEYSDSNDTPVLTAGKTFILGKTNESNGVFRDLPVIIFDDFTTATQFVDFPFKVKSTAMKILRLKSPENEISIVHAIMKAIRFVMSDHKRYWISEYQHIEIKLPDPIEQRAIAGVLADMDAEIAALTAQAGKTRLLKQAMMQELLTGRTRLPIPEEADA